MKDWKERLGAMALDICPPNVALSKGLRAREYSNEGSGRSRYSQEVKSVWGGSNLGIDIYLNTTYFPLLILWSQSTQKPGLLLDGRAGSDSEMLVLVIRVRGCSTSHP